MRVRETLAQRPGPFTGLRELVGAARFLLGRPALWPHALVPGLVLSVLVALSAWIAFTWFGPLLGSLVSRADTWYERLGGEVLHYLGAILATVFGALIALALTPPLCGPVLERLVVAQERALGVPERAPLGLLSEIVCGVRAQACAALFALPLLTLLWLVDLALPAAAIVTVPGKFLVAALALAWNLFDYPLTLRGVRMRERVRLVARHKLFSLGFGAAFALLFLVPCCAVLLLPVGVIAATRSVWTVLLHDPEVLPHLERPSRSAAHG